MKYVAIIEADRVKFYRLKKGQRRQMVSVAGRLYRSDDDLMLRDMRSDACMVIYRIDSSQPLMPNARLVDPDETRAYMDSAIRAGNRKKKWIQLDSSKAWEWLTIIIVLGALAYGFLGGAGL